MDFTLPPDATLLFDGSSGIYIPQRFAKEILRERVKNVTEEQYEILEIGPEHEYYWDVWDEVSNNAILRGAGDRDFFLYQEDDVWMVPCDVPVYDEENIELLAEHMASMTPLEDLKSHFEDSLVSEYRSAPELFFQDAEDCPEIFNVPDTVDEYADLPALTKLALDRWAKEGRMGGHFIYAVLTNDLMSAYSHADTSNRKAMDVITKYIYNKLPAGCWGSKEEVEAWPAMLGVKHDA